MVILWYPHICSVFCVWETVFTPTDLMYIISRISFIQKNGSLQFLTHDELFQVSVLTFVVEYETLSTC